jgi:hypothetical protein
VSQQSPEPAEQPAEQPTFPQYPQQPFPAAPPLEAGYAGGVAGGGYGDPGQYGPPRTSKLAITSLILGIISLPLLFAAGIGVLFALVGLILGIVGIAGARRKNLKRGIGIAGIVLSAIGLIGGGLLLAALGHAASSCNTVDKNDRTAYSNCLKHNMRL